MDSVIEMPTGKRPRRAQAHKRLHVGCIIQARMGSRRFPGKVLAPLLSKPVLEHVIERCRLIKTVHNFTIVVASPDLPESEPIFELTDNLGVMSFAGNNLNVLERYYECALLHKFDVIMRITADCPFIDPIVCEEILTVFLMSNADYASNVFPKRTYPKGFDCEVFSMDCLEAAYFDWRDFQKLLDAGKIPGRKMHDRCSEHVTPWMQTTSGIKRMLVQQRTKNNVSIVNYCVDYPEDIPRLERLYEKDLKKTPIIWQEEKKIVAPDEPTITYDNLHIIGKKDDKSIN